MPVVLNDELDEYYYDSYNYELTQYERLKEKTLKPYYIWRDNFIEDRCINRNEVVKEFVIASLPHFLLNFALFAYIFLGAWILPLTTLNVSEVSMKDAVLFAYTTITTIGYGNIYPVSQYGKIACMLYSMLGIPLIYMVLSNDGQFLTDFYWILRKSMSKKEVQSTGDLPIYLTGFLLIVHSIIGGLIFSYWIDQMPFIAAVYFSFISIATIGYGDLTPTPESWFQISIIVLYMSTGIIILSTLLGSLSTYLRYIHNIGRPISNSKDIEVWFGGDMLTVEHLVQLVADQFGRIFPVDALRLHDVIQDLDEILRVACDDESIADPTLMRKLSTRESCVNMETKSMLTTLETPYHSLTIKRARSESNLQGIQFTAKETEMALAALGVIHHKIRKEAGRRTQSERMSPRSARSSSESNASPKNGVIA